MTSPFVVAWSLALAGAAPLPDAGVAPAEVSAPDGRWGRDFVPRYADVADAQRQRAADLAALDAALDAHADIASLRAEFAQRRHAVQAWIDRLRDDAVDPRRPRQAQLAALAELDLVLLEAATLDAQLARLPTASEADDRFVFGHDLVVAPTDVVRDAFALGGDVVVRGHVVRHATSLGGDVRVEQGGRVDGEAAAFGGEVVGARPAPGATAPPLAPEAALRGPMGLLRSAVRFVATLLALAATAILVHAVAPGRVGRVAEHIEDHPLRALTAGAVGTFLVAVATLSFAVTVIGLPLSIALVVVLGLGWLLGFAASSQAVGARIPGAAATSRTWVPLLTGAVVLGTLSTLPYVGAGIAIVVGLAGLGAALTTRLGRAAAS